MNKQKESKVLALRAEGSTIQDIALQVGITQQEVVDTIAAEGYTIKTLQGIATEAKLRTLRANRMERISTLALLRDKLQEELDSRDLSEVPTEKLISLIAKLTAGIREEVTPPTILPTNCQSDWVSEDRQQRADIAID